MPPIRTLTLREQNRATLARQLLLERAPLDPIAAIERLVGLQAQLPQPPFVGLWSRLQDFEPTELADAIRKHEVVRATTMRATLHLLAASDYVTYRQTLHPALTEGWAKIAAGRGATFDLDEVLTAGREYIAEAPRTFAELSAYLTSRWPDQDVGAMRYALRTHLPLVQLPTADPWCFPTQPAFTLAEPWLGQLIDPVDRLDALIRRYLAAFGPAGVTDMQTWSGLSGLGAAFEQLRPELAVYRAEGRRELFDLPDAPLPDADIPAPVRLLPEFDNLLLSHSNRTRVVASQHRTKVYLPGLRVAATILVDGVVAGTWRIERTETRATLRVAPFATLSAADRSSLADEGERLLRFAAPDAGDYAVQVQQDD